jgi:general secretion pathway protein G
LGETGRAGKREHARGMARTGFRSGRAGGFFRQLLIRMAFFSLRACRSTATFHFQMKIHPTSANIRRRSGFTLLEMVIVLGIIAMIMGGAIFAMRNISSQAKPTQAKSDINAFLSALSFYKINKGHYPSSQEGLQALVTVKAMSKITQDPWGRDYVYRFPGKINTAEPEIISLGEDGKEGTEDDVNSQKL